MIFLPSPVYKFKDMKLVQRLVYVAGISIFDFIHLYELESVLEVSASGLKIFK